MPHEIMNTMHETGMPGSHHWLYWAVIVVVTAVLFFLAWRFIMSLRKRRTPNDSRDGYKQNER